MLNYLVSPDLSASAEFSDSLEAAALRAVPAYGMSEYYDPTEANEAYGEDDDFGDEDEDLDDYGDDDFGDDDFGDEDDFGGDEDYDDDDDFGGEDEDLDDDFGDDEDDLDEFGAPVGIERTNYARLAREVTNLINKGKRGLPKTQSKIARLRKIWSSLEGKPNGTSGLDAPWQILREAVPAAAASPGARKFARKVMPTLPPIRTALPIGIPATNADRIVAERASSRAEARSRFKLRGPEIIAQMKNYTMEKLVSIASNPNRGPEVRQAARDEMARRRAGRPAMARPAQAASPQAPGRPGRPARPVIVVRPGRPGRPGRPAAPVSAPAAPFMTGPSETPTFGVVPRIVAADNVFDAIGAFKAEAALLGLGVFLLGTYAGPPLFRRLTR